MRHWALALVGLCVASVADARKPKKPKTPPPEPLITDVQPAERELDPDAPAVEPTDDLWSWVSRLEGEDPSPEARQVLKERSEEHFAELGLIEKIGPTDVPVEFYRDPAKALAVDPLYLDLVDPKEFDIPVTVNESVAKWVRYFTGPGRKYYERWLGRSTRYRPMMYRMLEKEGMPRDLVYLSMIESGYSPHAYSVADAAGLWQFIPSTARMYRMRVDFWMDERRDPERSTQAGLEFLKDLHGMFGDWYLAWASYNTGPGRVKRATTKAGTTDFWKLAEGNYFVPETENYVPKIIAAAIIGKHPERYGFTNIEFQEELVYETTRVDGSVDVEALAKCAEMSTEDFQALNPSLRRFATPPEGADIRLPVGRQDAFVAKLASMPKNERLAVSNHKVKRGETLSMIAKKYGVSTQDLVRANRLKNSNRIVVGMMLVIPGAGRGEAVAAVAEAEGKASKRAPESKSSDTQVASLDERRATDAAASDEPPPVRKNKYHTVKSGDTLSKIAGKYKVSMAKLRSWNSLKSDRILVGQKLKVGLGSSETPKASAAAAPKADAPKAEAPAEKSSETTTSRYTVKKGDSLSGIAAKYGVSMSDLQKWNKIKNPSGIQAGQVLKIIQEDTGWSSYKVRSGDSLGSIATKHGCSVDQLKAWNSLSSTVIHPGQVLQVKK